MTRSQRSDDWLNLQAAYGGYPTACFTTAEGLLTVLAWGEAEVSALLAGLTDAERKRVAIEFPDSATVFISVDGPEPGTGKPEARPVPQEAERVGSD